MIAANPSANPRNPRATKRIMTAFCSRECRSIIVAAQVESCSRACVARCPIREPGRRDVLYPAAGGVENHDFVLICAPGFLAGGERGKIGMNVVAGHCVGADRAG